MNELLASAKAVIARWDCVSHARLGYYVGALSDAVELADNQAEKQEADFNTWWERTYGGKTCRAFAEDSWKTAQQFERERIKDVVAGLLDPKDPWIHYSTLLEKIDGD